MIDIHRHKICKRWTDKVILKCRVRFCNVCVVNKDTLAAPVLLGIMLKLAARPPLQSLLDGPSTVF